MDIGGDDLYFPGTLDTQAPDMVWRMCRATYPQGWYVRVDDSPSKMRRITQYDARVWRLPCELFVYPGLPPVYADDERPQGFLHIFLQEDGMTFVVDNDPPDPAQAAVVNDIHQALVVNHLFRPALHKE